MKYDVTALGELLIDLTQKGIMGAILHQILMNGWRGYSRGELKQMLHFANAAAAIVTTKTGALRAMPSPRAIYELMESEDTKNVCKYDCFEF